MCCLKPFCIVVYHQEKHKVDKMEVSKQFPMLKEQLLYKLEGIGLHEERRLEENASVLASQVLLSPISMYKDKTKTMI